jgi:hypothetical protein
MKLTLKYIDFDDDGNEIGTKEMPIETRTMTMKLRDELDNASARFLADNARLEETQVAEAEKGNLTKSKNNRYYRYMIEYMKIIANRLQMNTSDKVLFDSPVEESDSFWLTRCDMKHLTSEVTRFREATQ